MKDFKIRCVYSCPICDKEVLKKKVEIEKSKNGKFYCSRNCMGIDMNRSDEYPCANCGKLKLHPPRIVKRNENLFCSRECYDEFQNTSLKLECSVCGSEFLRQKAQYENQDNHYCSVECRNKGIDKRVLKSCTECGKKIKVHKYKIENSESGNHFCSKSCTGKYYTRNKSFGVNRSKFEEWLEERLPNKYEGVKFDFNNKEEIGYELDIFIPGFGIAIEINGITHYEPIYGEDRLLQTKELDIKKKVLCEEKGIELHTIDVSGIRNWKPERTKKHYEIICKIIDRKIK